MNAPATSSEGLGGADALERRFMAAAIRYARRHLGLTGTNPSVATLIVRDDGAGPVIVGRGVTAIGGRPHAETQALDEAGALARGATAYVTLEPCAHHGRTPPCAEALVRAGVSRVVAAASDPDPRVSGRGYAILRAGGIAVEPGLLAEEAAVDLGGYLARSVKKRPQVTLKLAISADGMIGRRGAGQVAITGPVAGAQVHLMRARADAIVIGIGTALADDPMLTCRLPGLAGRSPVRIVLDRDLRLPLDSKLVASAGEVPVWIAASSRADPVRRAALEAAGCRVLATELYDGRIALPELVEDLAAQGMGNLMVEGGALTASEFLDDDLVDRIVLFHGTAEIGARDGVAAPDIAAYVAQGFVETANLTFGDDRCTEFRRRLSTD